MPQVETLKLFSLELEKSAESADRFEGLQYPVTEDGKPTQYNWMVQHSEQLRLGHRTDIGAFIYINAKYGVIIEDFVQVMLPHCVITKYRSSNRNAMVSCVG